MRRTQNVRLPTAWFPLCERVFLARSPSERAHQSRPQRADISNRESCTPFCRPNLSSSGRGVHAKVEGSGWKRGFFSCGYHSISAISRKCCAQSLHTPRILNVALRDCAGFLYECMKEHDPSLVEHEEDPD